MDGFEVLREVRTRHCRTPILVLTAVDAVPKIVEVFDLGADDYLAKPFILEILLARVSVIAPLTGRIT
jgi:two-component system OmpR family response regulator